MSYWNNGLDEAFRHLFLTKYNYSSIEVADDKITENFINEALALTKRDFEEIPYEYKHLKYYKLQYKDELYYKLIIEFPDKDLYNENHKYMLFDGSGKKKVILFADYSKYDKAYRLRALNKSGRYERMKLVHSMEEFLHEVTYVERDTTIKEYILNSDSVI